MIPKLSWLVFRSVQPIATSATGVQNNTITVNLSDFDVIEALTNMDAVPTGSSPPGDYGTFVPPNPLAAAFAATSAAASAASSTSPPAAPAALAIDPKTTKPPLLPPQLLQVSYPHLFPWPQTNTYLGLAESWFIGC